MRVLRLRRPEFFVLAVLYWAMSCGIALGLLALLIFTIQLLPFVLLTLASVLPFFGCLYVSFRLILLCRYGPLPPRYHE